MKLTYRIGGAGSEEERDAAVEISPGELAAVHLHLAHPEGRNRTDRYMRRHGPGVDPNHPRRAAGEPPKLTIPEHLDRMVRSGIITRVDPPPAGGPEPWRAEPARVVVPVSDVVSNLLRPCFHRDTFGGHRLFHFADEPITARPYWCACYSRDPSGAGRVELRWVRFDPAADRAFDPAGADLLADGLVWAAALVPLVVDGRPLPTAEIAAHDYDLRQFLGRGSGDAIREAYAGWFDRWAERVAAAVARQEQAGEPFARFYHSVLGVDRAGTVHVRQTEADLPGLASDLAREGLWAAGLLDSGGSCAVYDAWLGGYVNHGWYFREPRGAVLVFELTTPQRVPRDEPGAWVRRRAQG